MVYVGDYNLDIVEIDERKIAVSQLIQNTGFNHVWIILPSDRIYS